MTRREINIGKKISLSIRSNLYKIFKAQHSIGYLFYEDQQDISLLHKFILDFENKSNLIKDLIYVFRKFSGQYVFIFCDLCTEETYIIQSWDRQFRLYASKIKDKWVIDSDLDRIVRAKRASLCSKSIAAFVKTQALPRGRTAFWNIIVFEPGEVCRLVPILEQNYAYINFPIISESCERIVRHSIVGVVDRILSHERPNLLMLSGGVDSSALAAAIHLARKSEIVEAVHLYSEADPSGYEQELAKRVSESTQIKTSFIGIDEYRPFSSLTFKKLPFPTLRTMYGSLLNHLMERFGEDVRLLEGQGGDALFLSRPIASSAVDALLERGLRKSWRVVRACADQELRSLSSVILEAVSETFTPNREFQRGSRHAELVMRDFGMPELASSLRDSIPRISPFSRPGEEVRLRHLELTLRVVTGCGEPSLPNFVYPLMVHNVLEAAMSIPAYACFDGKFDRLPLRSAFTDMRMDISSTAKWSQSMASARCSTQSASDRWKRQFAWR